MKKFICLLMVLTLVGCDGNGSSASSNTHGTDEQKKETVNLQEIDISGTWLVREESDSYNKENDDYLATNFSERTIIINDTAEGIEFSRCEYYDIHRPNTGVKSQDHLYLQFDNNGYSYNNGDFVRSWEEDDYFNDKIVWQNTIRLIKLSDEVKLDSGSFSLSSPLQISEQNHVCIRNYSSTLSTDRSFTIFIPTQDDIISFDLYYWGDIDTTSYVYDWDNYDNQIRGISLRDDKETFYSATGEYYPYMTNGTVTFTEASEAGVSGSFTAISQEGNEYTGSFEAIF